MNEHLDQNLSIDSTQGATAHEHHLILIRVIWWTVALLALGFIAVGVPDRYAQLSTVSPGANTLVGQLRPDQAHALEQTGIPVTFYAVYFTALDALIALLFASTGLVIVWFRPKDRAAVLLSLCWIGMGLTAISVGMTQPRWHLAIIAVRVVWYASSMPAIYLFPDGRFVPRWTRWLTAIWLIYTVAWLIFPAISPPLGLGQGFTGSELPRNLWFLLWICSGLAAQIYRYRHVSNALERQQMKWVEFGFGSFVILFVIGFSTITLTQLVPMGGPTMVAKLAGTSIALLGTFTVPLSLGVSILRYRLFDIDILINRTLVYGALTASVVAVYVLIVGGFGILFQTQNNLLSIIIAILLIAFLFQPLRRRLQDIVNHLVPVPRAMLPQAQRDDGTVIPEGTANTTLRGRWFAWSTWILTCCVALSTLPFVFLNRSYSVPESFCCSGFPAILLLSFIVACVTVGTLIASRQVGNSIGWILCSSSLALGLWLFALHYAIYTGLTQPGSLPGGDVMAWVAAWLWVPGWSAMLSLLLLFPNGRLLSRRWWLVAMPASGVLAAMVISLVFMPGQLGWSVWIFRNPFGVEGALGNALSKVMYFSYRLFMVSVLASSLSLILRFHRATGVEKQQIKWLAYAGTMAGMTFLSTFIFYGTGVLGNFWVQVILFLPMIGLPLSVGIAVLKYRLYDIDLLINRTLVYGALTGIVISAFVLMVGFLSILFQSLGNSMIAVLATGLVALFFNPLRQRLQHGVNRLMYGERDDPYAALSRLGRRLEASLAPEAVLPTVVTTVREVLKLPYVAIYLKQDSNGYKIIAESALPSLRLENGRIIVPGMNREGLCIPLIYQGETLGYIVLGPRAPNEAFGSTDMRLLEDLAPQVGVAVHAVRLTADLQRSREQLVLAREEERRRLRRDLHDDLAPTLASLGLTASTAADLIQTNPITATALVKELQTEIRATVGNIRRLVYDLRPPALDELGLLAAVRERAAQYSNAPDGVLVTVDAPAELPVLPAAVEVAAYRIVQEGLENISKHSQARQCVIRFANHNGLEIEITDNGIGLPSNITAGVGLRSMRERAEELGGSCVIERGMNRGTRVLARLPIGDPDGSVTRIDRG